MDFVFRKERYITHRETVKPLANKNAQVILQNKTNDSKIINEPVVRTVFLFFFYFVCFTKSSKNRFVSKFKIKILNEHEHSDYFDKIMKQFG